MEKINLSDLLEPEHMDPVKRIALIRIVDDDGGVRESYKFLIESEGWRVKTYPSAEAFLEEDDPTVPGCGVFDVRMTGITGMELHQKLIELANRLPVIFVSAHGDIEMAVKAMRRGAVDFLTKPVVDEKLLSSIDRAVARSCEEAAEAETVRELAGLWQALSPRECQVAQLAAEGLTTKAVSDVLGIAERTAQVHVAHVCSRLGVVLAGGGFSRNMEMMRLYAPGLSDVLPALDEGADGSLIQAAADIGAALVGMSYFEVRLFASTLGLPGDPSDYILVNARGERFMREDRRRSTLAEAVVRQPDGMAWMVINAPGADPLRPTTAFRETVIATISGYNDCIRTKERDSLGRDPLTMRPIGPGVEIRPVLPRILWSYGGLEINEKAEVIDRRGRPMKGLAAAGDITGGIHGEHALMGDMLASAAVFGRIAARTLVKNGRAVKRKD